MADLFISYSREDQEVARRFAEGFERAGLSVWWDQSLNPGEAFDQVTEQALEQARAVIVLWSKNSVSSRWVRAEATQANADGRLVPVMVEACKRPIMFELTHTADLSKWKGNLDDPTWQAFIASLQRFVRHGAHGVGEPGLPIQASKPSLRERLVAFASTLLAALSWTGSLLRRHAGSLALVLLGAAMAGLIAWQLRPQIAHEVTHFAVDLPGTWSLGEPLAISPDGRRIVYSIQRQLYVQRLDQDAPTPIPGATDAGNPFFSADGKSVAFFNEKQLKAVGFDGEAPHVLANIPTAPGLVGSWDADGRILFGQNGGFGLSQVAASGGEPVGFAALESKYSDFDYPDVLPGGKWVLFTAQLAGPDSRSWSKADIVAQNVATGERKLVLHEGHFARYLPTGHLVFARGGILYAVPMDAGSLAVRGQPVPVIQGVATNEVSGHAAFAVASNGTLAFVPGVPGGGGRGNTHRVVVRVNRAGEATALPGVPRDYRNPRPSPDGSKVAVEVAGTDDSVQIWIVNATSGVPTQLTVQGEENRFPVWTADGREVLYTSKRGDTYAIYRQPADGSGTARPVIEGSSDLVATDVIGRTLIYQDKGASGYRDIYSLELDSTAKPQPLLATPADETGARISPNGKWIVYASNETPGSGFSPRVYVRPFPNVAAGQRAVSDGNGLTPFWSPTGDQIFYVSTSGSFALMAMHLAETATTITPTGGAERLFDLNPFEFSLEGTQHTVIIVASPKSDGFVALSRAGSDTSGATASRPQVKVILNWFEELKQRVPVE
jgi:Tol biopolymer transport system component